MVHAVMTDDTDVLAYGCPIMVTKVNFGEGTCTEINHYEILDELGMTSEQFLDFCIMCGTDYNTSMNRIGCERSYKLIMECDSIEGIANTYPDLPVFVLNHLRMREIFNYELPYDYVIPPPASPDFPKLLEFCFIQNCQTQIDLKNKDKDTKNVRIL
jgi:5'-3' exonuclease